MSTYIIHSQSYTQKTGLAMGNNLAPTLAIIYMRHNDSASVEAFHASLVLKRYIDNILTTWTSETINIDKLPFLDMMISFNQINKKFARTLCIKPISSQCILAWRRRAIVLVWRRCLESGEMESGNWREWGKSGHPQLWG